MTERVPKNVVAKLDAFFRVERLGRIKCVVTGEDSSWHHLDDNHENHTLSNIIPLAHRLNSHLGGLKNSVGSHVIWLGSHLEPNTLLSASRHPFPRVARR